jgi:hypothetical protein
LFSFGGLNFEAANFFCNFCNAPGFSGHLHFDVMKTTLIVTGTLALFTAAFLFSFALGATLTFAAAFGAIVVADYTRASRVLRLPATVALGARTEKFGLAA